MVTKMYKSYVGYGLSEEEALDSCKIISVLQDAYNIRGFDGLENQRTLLAPWNPKDNTLQISKAGYITCAPGGFLQLNGAEPIKSFYMFETLYKLLFDKLSMLEVALCSTEIDNLIEANHIQYHKLAEYDPIYHENFDLDEEGITAQVITEKYTIVFFNYNKVSIKRNAEECFWSTSFKEPFGSAVDALFYIAYFRGYENIDHVLRGGTLDGRIYPFS